MQEYHLLERYHNQSIQVGDHNSIQQQNSNSDTSFNNPTNCSDIITQAQTNIIKELQNANDQVRKELAATKLEQIQLQQQFESSTKQFTSIVESQQNKLEDNQLALQQYKLLASQQESCLKQFCHSTNWQDLLQGLEQCDFNQVETILQERDLRQQISQLIKASNNTVDQQVQETQTLNQSSDFENIVFNYQRELVRLCQLQSNLEKQMNEQIICAPQELELHNQFAFAHTFQGETQQKFTQPSVTYPNQQDQTSLSQDSKASSHNEHTAIFSDIPILLRNLIDIYQKYINLHDNDNSQHNIVSETEILNTKSVQVETEVVQQMEEKQIIINPMVYQELNQQKQKCVLLQEKASQFEQSNSSLMKENKELLSRYFNQTQKISELKLLLDFLKIDSKTLKKQNNALLQLHSIELKKDSQNVNRTSRCLQENSALQEELRRLQNVAQESQVSIQQLSEKLVNCFDKIKVMQSQITEKNVQLNEFESVLTELQQKQAADGKLLFEQQQLIFKLQANQHISRNDDNIVSLIQQQEYLLPEDQDNPLILLDDIPSGNDERGHQIKYEALQIQYNIMCQRNKALSKQVHQQEQMIQRSDLC